MRSSAPAIVKALLAAGANPDVRDNRVRTPLHYAVAKDGVILAVVEALSTPAPTPPQRIPRAKPLSRASSPTPRSEGRRRTGGWGGEFRLKKE